ncbi:MAG: SCP2 sterol-binding domain-containing protein [Porticoccaceae bacterium]|nr:SCP2 sterol-binding domain-containing protein [Porticoccaceae bacterium]
MTAVTNLALMDKGIRYSTKLLTYGLKSAPDRAVAFILSTLLNQGLKNSLGEGDFDFFDGKTLAIAVDDTAKILVIEKRYNRLRVSPQLEEKSSGSESPLRNGADVIIKGSVASFILMISGTVDPDTLFFRRKITITGNTDLSLAVKNMLGSLEPEKTLPKPLLFFITEYARAIGRAMDRKPPGNELRNQS